MSRTILNAILNEMQVWLNEIEREQLYNELLAYFGLIGALNECEALENAWKDPYNRREIEEFIKAWLRRKRRRKEETVARIAVQWYVRKSNGQASLKFRNVSSKILLVLL